MEERLQKLIARAGICSRRKAEDLILDRKVKVNGKAAIIGQKADPKVDKITVNGKNLRIEKKRYFLIYKPRNYVTTMSDEFNRPCITAFLESLKIKERLFTVGRLDYDSEGLIIVTNDGELANKISHPSFEIKKTYLVILGKPLKEEDAEKIRAGVEIERRIVQVSDLKILDYPKHFEITIHEGRNRIIRRLMEALNYKIMRLIRIRIGGIELGKMRDGEFKEVTREEIEVELKVEKAQNKKEPTEKPKLTEEQLERKARRELRRRR